MEFRQLTLLALGVLVVGVLIVRVFHAFAPAPLALEQVVGQKIYLEGLIVAEPDERDTNTRLIFRPDHSPAKVLLLVSREPRYAYGDRLRVGGEFVKPENFEDFDYINYLAKDSIFYQMFYPELTVLARGEGLWVTEKLLELKHAWLAAIGQLIPEPAASLAGGLVVGTRAGLGQEWQETFRRVGVSHVVVLSGYNITIVAESIMRGLSWLPRTAGLSLGALGILLFVLMAGASATVVRAALMAGIVILARLTGREYRAGWALVVAAALMIIHSPKILVYDVSFQLSFLATLGLIYACYPIEKRLTFLPKKFKIREITATTIAAQLFVLPLLLYRTGELSLVALPVNILILPFIPATMFVSFVAGALGLIATWLGWIPSVGAWLLLSYELLVARVAGSWSAASVAIDSFPLWLMIVFYAIILRAFVFKKKKHVQ